MSKPTRSTRKDGRAPSLGRSDDEADRAVARLFAVSARVGDVKSDACANLLSACSGVARAVQAAFRDVDLDDGLDPQALRSRRRAVSETYGPLANLLADTVGRVADADNAADQRARQTLANQRRGVATPATDPKSIRRFATPQNAAEGTDR